ncbi:outer membrane protein, nutrient binding [Filimonas lacunae]|nr:outer membrane protein, nutrient binding [Filimonas lacunae]
MFLFTGCRKLVEVQAPVTGITAGNVYETDATAIAVMTGMYTQMSLSSLPDGANLSLCLGMSADEFTLYAGVTNTGYQRYYQNAHSALLGLTPDFWTGFYNMIYTTNSVLEGVENSPALTPAVKQQLQGEAKFMRAFSYYYLVNLFGGVPVVTSTNYNTNGGLARSAAADVWKRIIVDLTDAKALLSGTYLDATLLKASAERVRPTRWAAIGLLSRAYLYSGDYVNAAAMADTLIANATSFSIVGLNSAFLKASAGNNEAIWQLQAVATGFNTQEARLFIIPSTGPAASFPVYLRDSLLNSFEKNDKRKTSWINSVTTGGTTYSFPYKYKVNTVNAAVTEFSTVLRLGEQYLIRAEARAKLHNTTDARTDMNVIRKRAGLDTLTLTDETALLDTLQHERRVELFSEWGHRWLDLKRTGKADAVMPAVTAAKGGTWSTNWQLYPIAFKELQADPALKQNEGYN